jgi:hypothetical protein
MKVGYLIILLFFGYVAWKYYGTQQTVAGTAVPHKEQNRPGVSVYHPKAYPQSAQQLQAFARRNNMQTTQFGYAPALGANENQPNCRSTITV